MGRSGQYNRNQKAGQSWRHGLDVLAAHHGSSQGFLIPFGPMATHSPEQMQGSNKQQYNYNDYGAEWHHVEGFLFDYAAAWLSPNGSTFNRNQTFTRSDLGSYIGFNEASAFTRVPMTSIS